jgi:hypothetical protein
MQRRFCLRLAMSRSVAGASSDAFANALADAKVAHVEHTAAIDGHERRRRFSPAA